MHAGMIHRDNTICSQWGEMLLPERHLREGRVERWTMDKIVIFYYKTLAK